MIPNNIIVTARERPGAWLSLLAEANPGHQIHYFDDDASRALVAQHFGGDTLVAYDKVVPKAYRADLFRYCALQVMGGIYTDPLIPYGIPFEKMWDLARDRVYLVRDIYGDAIQVASIACNRNSRFMQLCQQKATRNILNEYYGESPLSITGPRMAWRCFREYTGESLPQLGRTYAALEPGEPPVQIDYQIGRTHGDYRLNVSEAVFVDRQRNVVFPYKFNRFRGHREDEKYYWKAWHRRTVYGEKG